MSSFQEKSSSESTSSVATACRTREVADTSEWLQRVRSIQQERCTPEVLERIQSSAKRRQQREIAFKTATRLERGNVLATRSAISTMRCYDAISSAPPAPEAAAGGFGRFGSASAGGFGGFGSAAGQERSADACARQSRRAQMIQSSCSPAVSAATAEEADANLDALEAELAEDETIFAAESVVGGAVVSAGPVDMATEISSLLGQLAVEPAIEAEVVAKFTLFETFLATVVTIREETIKFWVENQGLFLGASKDAGQREIDAIDSHDALAVAESRRWFVYDMTQKAHSNSVAIAGALSKLKSRLELLSQEVEDCPFCLDPIAPEICTTLGCCHRVCTPCWQHWTEVKGAAAFCPLCKHVQFQEDVIGSP